MSRRYDGRTTTFSPEGRLYQVEYAIEAINNAGSAMGILCNDGVVLTAEKKTLSKLLAPSKSTEKILTLDSHMICAVAGLTADANILVQHARHTAQRYELAYQTKQPCEQLVQAICNHKQVYTQFGGQRPFGVSFLYAGYDEYYGFQLYHSDPSGNYGGWKATAIGANHRTAKNLLKQEYNENISIQDALKLSIKIMNKTLDTSLVNADKLEIMILRKHEKMEDQIVLQSLQAKEIVSLLKEVEAENPATSESGEHKMEE